MSSLSREQVRAVDRWAIDSLGVPGVVLMENAGRGAADAIEKFLGDLPRVSSRGLPRADSGGPPDASSSGIGGCRVAVVAGAGNNGGDGFVVARHLAMRGATVAVFLVADAEKIAPDAAVNLKIIRNLGLDIREKGTGYFLPAAQSEGGESRSVEPGTQQERRQGQKVACTLFGSAKADGKPSVGFGGEEPALKKESAPKTFAIECLSVALREFDLVVDAVGGTGIRGPLRGDQAAAVEQINAAGLPVVALDIPTGLDCDTGRAEGPAVRAALTVTFVARKKGFDAPGAEAYTGKVVVADIGVPPPREP